jgi:hypothetical protein
MPTRQVIRQAIIDLDVLDVPDKFVRVNLTPRNDARGPFNG